MTIILFMAGWLGRNISTLLLATIVTGVVALVIRAVGERRASMLRGFPPAVFVAVFAYSGARSGAAWYYFLTEDRAAALNWLFGLGAIGVLLIVLVVALRDKRTASLLAAAASALLLGSSGQIAEKVVGDGGASRSDANPGPFTPAAPPSGYPAVQIWTSTTDRFGARFPEAPVRTQAAAQAASGHAWQGVFDFPTGGALASVTVMPLPRGLAESQYREFAEGAHASFVATLGAAPSATRTEWKPWTDGRTAYWYEVDFTYESSPIRGFGFWVFDSGRILRVSTAYPLALAVDAQEIARHFPHTFVLLGQASR